MNFFFIFIILFSFFIFSDEKKFVVIIPSYNNKLYYKRNLDSVFIQDYKNYRVIYIVDGDEEDYNDNTGQLVKEYIRKNNQEHKVTLIRNKKRLLALANIYKAVISCQDDEIVVLLDGDDQLSNNKALSLLNRIYNEKIWITHGNFKYLSTDSICDYNPSFPDDIIKQNQFRDFPHGLIHLRTFYAWLFKQIKIEDLFYEGNFLTMTYDVAIFLPMIEMAGERHKFINEVLYIYNDINSINDHKVNLGLQHYLNKFIRKKDKYERLKEAKSNFLGKFEDAKIDLIIFISSLEKLDGLLAKIKFLKKFNKIVLISGNDIHINDQDSSVIVVNKNVVSKNILHLVFRNIFDNDNEYIMFVDEKFDFEINIDLNDQIKNLELTKACGEYLGIDNPLIKNNVEILNSIYAFEYSKSKYTHFVLAAIYRKSTVSKFYNDLEKLEIEWKYIGWGKICLFKYIENA